LSRPASSSAGATDEQTRFARLRSEFHALCELGSCDQQVRLATLAVTDPLLHDELQTLISAFDASLGRLVGRVRRVRASGTRRILIRAAPGALDRASKPKAPGAARVALVAKVARDGRDGPGLRLACG